MLSRYVSTVRLYGMLVGYPSTVSYTLQILRGNVILKLFTVLLAMPQVYYYKLHHVPIFIWDI